MNRNAIGIDIVPEYCAMVRSKLQPRLLEEKGKYEGDKPE